MTHRINKENLMALFALLLALFPIYASASPMQMFIDIGSCVNTQDPTISFKVLMNGFVEGNNRPGILVFSELEMPDGDSGTMALTTTLEKQAEGEYKFAADMYDLAIRFTIKAGEETLNQGTHQAFRCKGKFGPH